MVLRSRHSRFALATLLLVLFGFHFAPQGYAQTTTTESPSVQPASPGATLETKLPRHKFWDRENAWLFAGVAASRALDYTSTKNMLGRGREELLIPDDVVFSEAGFPALEAAGAATSVGISYIFHR